MQIGRLDQKIQLERQVQVNDSGSLKNTWEPIATVWGRVISQKSDEAFEAARLKAKETIRIQVRLRSDVDTKGRLKWLDKYYNITNVDRSQHRRGEMWLTGELQ